MFTDGGSALPENLEPPFVLIATSSIVLHDPHTNPKGAEGQTVC
jgi:hypothetical protein